MKRGLPPLPKRVGENGKRPCRGCGADIPPRFQTWCSKDCRERHYLALSTYARPRVRERDHGMCSLCGCDAEFPRRFAWVMKRRDDYEAFCLLLRAWGYRVSAYNHWGVPNGWEADHIVPLAEGGTNDLANYRTLCIACHKGETKALAARLAAKRRELKEAPND